MPNDRRKEKKRPHDSGQIHNTHTHNNHDRPSKSQKLDHHSSTPQQNGHSRPMTAAATTELDRKHPSTAPYPQVHPYPHPPTQTPRSLHLHTKTYPPPLPRLAPHLENAPFQHSSYSHNKTGSTSVPIPSSAKDREKDQYDINYERLEFLGDAYLELIASRLIYSRFPALPVGRQSSLRERLVRNSTLAVFARLYGFENRIKKTGEDWSKERWEKVLGDTVEAYIAAVVLSEGYVVDQDEGLESTDRLESEVARTNTSTAPKQSTPPIPVIPGAGFKTAETWLTALWTPDLLSNDPNLAIVVNRKDELARAIGGKFVSITYKEEEPMTLTKDKSTQQHTVGVYLTGWGYENKRLAVGKGINAREAGSRAAGLFLDEGGELLVELKEAKRVNDEERRLRLAKEREEKEKGEDGVGNENWKG